LGHHRITDKEHNRFGTSRTRLEDWLDKHPRKFKPEIDANKIFDRIPFKG